MTTLFLILVLISILHFVYESIWAPTVRVKIQGDLFSLKRDLYQLEKSNNKKPYLKQIHNLDLALKNLVHGIHHAELWSVIETVAEVEKDKELKARLTEKVRLLDECKDENIKGIWEETSDLAVQIVRVNSGGWLVYIVPIGVFAVCLSKLHSIAKSLLSLPTAYLEAHSSDNGPISLGA